MENEQRPVEIKDLNKTQLILLSILLSFVVSIATGIMTVSLLQKAPQAVTQTINRVVQQTIEKAVPDYVPEQTQTVIVKEDDLVVDAVSKTRANIVPVFATADSKDSFANAYSAGNGMFVASQDGLDSTKTYSVENAGSNFTSVKVVATSTEGIALLAADPSDKSAQNFPSSLFGKDSDVEAGQTVIMISSNSIYKDTVQNILPVVQKDANGNITESWNAIAVGDDIAADLDGSPVANLDGNVIGFVSTSVSVDGSAKPQIIGIDAVAKMISDFQKNSQTPAQTAPVTQ